MEPSHDSVGGTIVQLVDDAKDYARAQADVWKAAAAARLRAAKGAAILSAAALVLALSALTALLVGLILALATVIGPLLATAVVIAATLFIAAILGWLAYQAVLRMIDTQP